jgi:hypothetical protein
MLMQGKLRQKHSSVILDSHKSQKMTGKKQTTEVPGTEKSMPAQLNPVLCLH